MFSFWWAFISMAAVLKNQNGFFFVFCLTCRFWKIGPKSWFFVKFLASLMNSALLNRIAKVGVVLPDFPFSCVGVLCMNWTKWFYFCMVFPHFKFIWELSEDRRLIHVGDFDGDCGGAPGVAAFEIAKVNGGVCCFNAKPVFCYCFEVQGLKQKTITDILPLVMSKQTFHGLSVQI